jgi:hypothetical protein
MVFANYLPSGEIMLRAFKLKSVVVLGATAVVLIAAVAAYAYWTTTGTGDGTAATGTTEGITVNQTTTLSSLYPGGTVALAGTFGNGNDGSVYVAAVDAEIESVTGPNIVAVTAPCTADDYQLNGFPVAVAVEVASGDPVGAWGIGLGLSGETSITMLDSSTNQDGCKDATVNLTYSSN